MKNKSLLSSVIRYVLLLVILVGGGFGLYSYMNENSKEPQVRVEQKVDSNKKDDKYVVDQAEKDYLSNKFKDLKAINNGSDLKIVISKKSILSSHPRTVY